MIEPKRHFKKPIELSPLVAIDRERCILCYRCVRFSQEVAEDYQLVFLERGDHTFVGTNDGAPYVAPFSGNIVELCPVGALTSTTYRFRARPWDIEDSGSICALCPSQCNVEFTVRDDARIVRVMARDNEDVDDGWLCDKGRYGYQAVHSPERITRPMVREGGALREVSWERALAAAAAGLEKAGAATAALAGGETTNEEGFLLQRLMREALGSPHVDSRPSGVLDPDQARVLARPDLSVPVWDIENAAAVLVLRHRPRRGGADHRPARAQGAPPPRREGGGRLEPPDDARRERRPRSIRFPPGGAEAALQRAGGATTPRGGGPVVVVWGERLVARRARTAGRRRAARARAQAEPPGHRGRRAARDPDRHERARPARGRLPAEPRPRPGRRARRPARAPTRSRRRSATTSTALVLLHADPLARTRAGARGRRRSTAPGSWSPSPTT